MGVRVSRDKGRIGRGRGWGSLKLSGDVGEGFMGRGWGMEGM